VCLKDFAPQWVGATQGCAQECAPTIGWTAPAAIFEAKAHVIANKSQQPLTWCWRHDWNQWLHDSMAGDFSESCRVRTKKLAQHKDLVRDNH
jgi:hypothetical protein